MRRTATVLIVVLCMQNYCVIKATTRLGERSEGRGLQQIGGSQPVRPLDKIYRTLQEEVFFKALTSFNRVCKRGDTTSEGKFIADMLGLSVNSAYNSIWQIDMGSECEIIRKHADLLAGLAVTGVGEALIKNICCQPGNLEMVKDELYKKLHFMLQSLTNTQCSDAQRDPGFIFSLRQKVFLASVDVSIRAAESVTRCPASTSPPGHQPARHTSFKPSHSPAEKATPVGSWPGYTLPLLATIQRCHGVAYACCSNNMAWCSSLGYVQVGEQPSVYAQGFLVGTNDYPNLSNARQEECKC